MEFFSCAQLNFSCVHWLAYSWDIESNTWEIRPYLRVPMYYSLFYLFKRETSYFSIPSAIHPDNRFANLQKPWARKSIPNFFLKIVVFEFHIPFLKTHCVIVMHNHDVHKQDIKIFRRIMKIVKGKHRGTLTDDRSVSGCSASWLL